MKYKRYSVKIKVNGSDSVQIGEIDKHEKFSLVLDPGKCDKEQIASIDDYPCNVTFKQHEPERTFEIFLEKIGESINYDIRDIV